MRDFYRYMSFAFAAACVATVAGCTSQPSQSQRASAELGAAFLEPAIKPMFDQTIGLSYSVNEFREAKKRWPKDYGELSAFLKQFDDKMYEAFQTVKYQRIDFRETADGKLRIDADYSFDSGVSGQVSGRIKGSGRLEGMKVSAFDPRDMTVWMSNIAPHSNAAPSISTNK